jgi:hypothetical protein
MTLSAARSRGGGHNDSSGAALIPEPGLCSSTDSRDQQHINHSSHLSACSAASTRDTSASSSEPLPALKCSHNWHQDRGMSVTRAHPHAHTCPCQPYISHANAHTRAQRTRACAEPGDRVAMLPLGTAAAAGEGAPRAPLDVLDFVGPRRHLQVRCSAADACSYLVVRRRGNLAARVCACVSGTVCVWYAVLLHKRRTCAPPPRYSSAVPVYNRSKYIGGCTAVLICCATTDGRRLLRQLGRGAGNACACCIA